MIDTSFLKLLDRFHLIIKKRITSNFIGPRSSMAYGRGLIFKDHKEYVPGDDFRSINWSVYARTEKLHIKRYEEERNMTIRIILDASASMDYGDKIKKFEFASMIAIGFAYMALKNNERFQITTFAEEMKLIKARKGGGQLLNLVSYLNDLKAKGKSDFKKSLDEYKKYIDSKSLIIIISDFLFDPNQLKEVLIRYKKSEVMVIQVFDPIERHLSLHGDMLLKDAETNVVLRTFISHRLKNKYHVKLENHINTIHDICYQTNSKFFSVTSNTSIFDVFYQILR